MPKFHKIFHKKQTAVFLIPLAVAGGFLLGGCGGENGDSDAAPTATTPGNSAAPKPATAEDSVPNGWKMLTSQEGNYEVIMPTNTENSNEDIPTDMGKLKNHMVIGSVTDDVAYTSSYVDYPSQVDGVDKDKLLDGAREGISKGNKVVSEKQIKMDGFPGRELVITGESEGHKLRMDARFFMVNRRLYQFLVVSTEGKRPEHTDSFLDSFKFLKPVAKK